jgi:hypothetical protein
MVFVKWTKLNNGKQGHKKYSCACGEISAQLPERIGTDKPTAQYGALAPTI